MRVVVIGGSWGGMAATKRVLAAVPANVDAALVLVLHRGKRSVEGLMEELLRHRVALPVVEVEDKEPLIPGRLYVAPADYHLLVDKGELALSTDPPVNFSRPSIDVLFESAAESYGPRCVAVLLSGANADGANGLRRVHETGGLALVEDPATAERPEMPAAGVATGCADVVAPVDELALVLREVVAGVQQ